MQIVFGCNKCMVCTHLMHFQRWFRQETLSRFALMCEVSCTLQDIKYMFPADMYFVLCRLQVPPCCWYLSTASYLYPPVFTTSQPWLTTNIKHVTMVIILIVTFYMSDCLVVLFSSNSFSKYFTLQYKDCVFLTFFHRSTWAPLERSICTTSALPLILAKMRAVQPSWGKRWDRTVNLMRA